MWVQEGLEVLLSSCCAFFSTLARPGVYVSLLPQERASPHVDGTWGS